VTSWRWLDKRFTVPEPSLGALGRLALLMSAGAAIYGAVLGGWQGKLLIVYVALKLPLVLLLTSALTLLLCFVGARALDLRLTLLEVAVLTFTALAVASLLLAALAPVAAFFEWACPRPSPAARLAHNLLHLMHTGFVGVSGLAGCVALRRGLRRAVGEHAGARRVFALWILAYALVGGEVAWALRPFVGSVFEPVAFLRADALRGNVYEFVFTDIVPYLLSD
jgi:hypothetical protein